MVNDSVLFVDCLLVLVSVVSGSVSCGVWIDTASDPHTRHTDIPPFVTHTYTFCNLNPVLVFPPSVELLTSVSNHKALQGIDKAHDLIKKKKKAYNYWHKSPESFSCHVVNAQ